MEGPRPPQKNEWYKVLDFLDNQLRPQTDWSVSEEFPLAMNPTNSENSRIITDGDRILSHALLKIHIIKTPLGLFKVAAIGSVVTDPQYRNQGLSQKILMECLKEAALQNCDFAILWTDLYDFYRKLDFELAGFEYSFVLPKNFSVPNPDLKFLNTKNVSPQALLKLYNQHRVGSMRNASDFDKYLKIPNTKLYTAWDENNQIQAYAVEGKGADLTGYIHEWGGNVSNLLPLLSYAQTQYENPLTIIVPYHSENLARQLSDAGALFHKGYLGMIRPLHLNNIFFKIQRHARSLGYSDLVLTQEKDRFLIGYKDNLFQVPTLKDLTPLLFGPVSLQNSLPLEGETLEVFSKILPLPMWIWGWESV